MATKLQTQAAKAVIAWCDERKINLIRKPAHVHPRSYVVGKAAPGCLMVALCWADGESHMREFEKANPLKTVYKFDESLRAGDWCILAYVNTATSGERVAIPIPEGE